MAMPTSLRGRALLAQNDLAGARLRFERAALTGSPEVKASARLGAIQVSIAGHSISPSEAIGQLDAMRFGWRGGPVEQRALTIEYGLGQGAAGPARRAAERRHPAALLQAGHPGRADARRAPAPR